MRKTILFALLLSFCVGFAQSVVELPSLGSPLAEGGSLFQAAPLAQPADPVKWSGEVKVVNGKANICLKASIDQGWHLYAQGHKGTALPLKLSLAPSSCYKPLQTSFTESPEATRHYDDFLQEEEWYHSGEVEYCMPIAVLCDSAFEISISYDGQACIDGSCVPVSGSLTIDSGVLPRSNAAVPEQQQDLGWFFLLAFLGGLLGILTPCVFPMIPMTVSYFMKHGGRKQAIFYGVSIILIYVIVGIILSALFGQGFANDISTHWLPNVLFTIIFILFAISLLGYFEITLPSRWVNGSAKNEERAGYVGTFFMALTLVLVSFSCTLPIAGAVALGAADGSWLKPIVGMLGFSLAFALPFTLFAFFPQWLAKLPRSGGWMGALKVTLAVVELAFALKFLSVADQAYNWGILNRELFIILWVVLFMVLGLYFLGCVHFPVDLSKEKPGWVRRLMAVLSFAVVVYLLPGIWGAPLNAISGWLPPMKTQSLFWGKSHSEMHHNLQWQQTAVMDYDEALDSARACNRPVLLMFTGHGCVNCRKMEQLCLANDSVAARLQRDFIICTLYVDDKVAKTTTGEYLGDKNKRLQKDLFHQNAQPCHYVLAPNGDVLSGPVFYETEPQRYLQFLSNTK